MSDTPDPTGQPDPTEPLNALEASLLRAAQEPEHRPAFARDLMASEVYVALFPEGDAPMVDEATGTMPEGTTLQAFTVEVEGRACWPFFSAPERVWHMTGDTHAVTPMDTRALFERHRGEWLMLNPGAPFGRSFAPDEVEALLQGAPLSAGEARRVERDTSAIVGTPADPPQGLANALAADFTRLPHVREAALLMVGLDGAAPELMVEVLVDGPREEHGPALEALVAARAPANRSLDLHVVDAPNPALGAALGRGTVAPFYVRGGDAAADAGPKRGWLKRLFSRVQ